MKNKYEISTTLVVPDAHVGPGQDMTRFRNLGKLIVDRRPDRIISLGDFITLESLSNWDLNKAGVMEGRRYQADIEAANDALALITGPLKELQEKQRKYKEKVYRPRFVYIHGNHESRLPRYLETRAELKQHLELNKDLNLYYHGVTDIIDYRESIEFDGVIFTHALMNMAGQPLAGKYAIHRASEISAKSVVFGHNHRKESLNIGRHGSDEILQFLVAGLFSEYTDEYAKGSLEAYWRGLVILTHWAEGRFDVEDISIERLNTIYY